MRRIAGTRPEPLYRLDRRLGQGEAGWCMVNAIKINLVVRTGQLVIGEKKRRICGHRLVEETSGFQKVFAHPGIEADCGKEDFGADVQIVSRQIRRGPFFDRCFLGA